MEAIGTAASAITIVALIGQIYDTISQVRKRYVDAQKEFDLINRELKIIKHVAKLLCSTNSDLAAGDAALTESKSLIIRQALSEVTEALVEILNECHGLQSQFTNKRSRLLWSIKSAPEIERILTRIGRIGTSLTVILYFWERCHVLFSNSQHSSNDTAVKKLLCFEQTKHKSENA